MAGYTESIPPNNRLYSRQLHGKRITGSVLRYLYIALVLLILPSVGCGGKKLESRWRNRDIVIDGKDTEWRGCEAYYDEENMIRIGLYNDDDNLYICLSTWNARIQTQLLRMGFTIWFDPEGGKKERFGIRYPMKSIDFSKSGIPRGEMPDGGVPGGEYPGRPEDVAREEMEEEHRIKPEMIRELLVRVRDSMELLGPGNDEHIGTEMYIEDAAMIGVEAMMDISNGRLVYELKVPLPRREDIPYTIGAAAGAEIGIGFELGKMERPAMPAEGMGPGGGMPGGGMPGGGMPGGGMPGGGMPGGGTPGGGPPGGGRGDRPEGSKSQPSFDIWTKVRLAHETEGISQGIKTSQ